MRVHFASGTHPFPAPWLNVDFHQPCDQVVDLLRPWPKNLSGIQRAYVGHFLEHLTPAEGVRFLFRLRTRMAPGGRLVVIGPDAVKGQRFFERGQIPAELLAAIRAHGEPNGNDRASCHLWDCTGDAVVAQAAKAGWTAEEFPIAQLPDRLPEVPVIDLSGWQFAVTATPAKPRAA